MSRVLGPSPTVLAPAATPRPGMASAAPRYQYPATSSGDGEASLEEKQMASQLAHLASQHHTSEYNKVKFGPAGSPALYVPLSIQFPAQYRELKCKQAQNDRKRTWWPAQSSSKPSLHEHIEPDSLLDGTQDRCLEPPPQQEAAIPYTRISTSLVLDLDDKPANYNKPIPPLNHPPTLNLQRELSVAMSSPLPVFALRQSSSQNGSQQLSNLCINAKTSASHPINISSIIPFELLPIISSHLIPSPSHAAHLFDLPPSLLLSHVTLHTSPASPSRPSSLQNPNEGVSSQHNDINKPSATSSTSSTSLQQKTIQSSVFESSVSVNGWISTKFHEMGQGSPKLNHHPPIYSNVAIEIHNTPRAPPFSLKDPISFHNCSIPLPSNQNRPRSAPPFLVPPSSPPSEMLAGGNVGPSPLPALVHAMTSEILDDDKIVESAGTTESPPQDIDTISPQVSTQHVFETSDHRPLTLGNMYLSSCPGKKVRLNGPVKGRGAIYRDLEHDLKRIKTLGVGCVICCLDDDELEFLGASWPRYSEVARQIGLDVLRIPIPEGLAPLTPAQLDVHLQRIIYSYTLKGIPVLVHCRGGVGRAGLIACCWILKLGLCGWFPSPILEHKEYHHGGGHHHRDRCEAFRGVKRETVALVEKAIAVVRRRRSVKAVETYEQVRFLVDFVEHLHAGKVTPR